ncbi:unnamed protein product [Toxocara canis]|uniref:Glycosyltransferase family 92 protein n=1 Tax=Toxocara canis TaxID=6265 RepID=A0A183TVA0_TOXCA|nr:unnamed protein product [Toxocara canis]
MQDNTVAVRVCMTTVPKATRIRFGRNSEIALTLSINDSVLRAQGRTEYVSLFDLDEIIVLRSNLTLLQNLDSAITDDRNIAAFIFRSSWGIFDDDTRSVTHPSEITFDSLRNISLENWVRAAGTKSKLIVRPEGVKVSAVHVYNVMEGSEYKGFTIDPAMGQIFHLGNCVLRQLLKFSSGASDIFHYENFKFEIVARCSI